MISITIPTHNRAQLLPRAIESILNQTFKNWELIIVDDGSTDKTSQVIEPYLKDNRIKFIPKENTGAAHSRNVGVENSKYDYISFLDSDDEAKPEWLKLIANTIEEHNASLICCGCEKLDHDGNLLEIQMPETKPEFFGNQVEYKMTNGGTFVIKKELFESVGGYDNELTSGQHTELSFRLIPFILREKLSITNIKKSLIKIHIHKGDRIRGNSKAKYLGSKRTFNRHKAFFNRRPLAKSLYAGIIAYNASQQGNKKEAFKFSLISFITNPSIKRFFRIFKYSI